MLSGKREQARIERRLIAALTRACETAKSEMVGFCWLTHEVDYARFADSLQIIWVFDTQASKDQALAGGQDQRMVELTAQALEDAGLEVAQIAGCVYFDSEEQCQRDHDGNWQKRILRTYVKRG